MITATYIGKGEYGFPGAGTFRSGETKEVCEDVARGLFHNVSFRLDFSDVHTDLATRVDGSPFVGFLGNVDVRSGYGSGSIDILRALHHQNIVADVDQRLGVSPLDLHPDAAAQLERRAHIPLVQIVHSIPDNFRLASSPVRIGWTMWETTRPPDGTIGKWGDWVAQINEGCDHLIVPSKHSKEVFEDNGVTRPISIINYGLDGDEWTFRPRRKDGIFRVVQYGDLTNRKGVIEAVAAFQQAFPTERNVQLHLKTQQGRLGVGHFGIPEFSDDRIIVHNLTWSRQQLRNFLADANVFIWLSRGEGFGLPPLQAALSGVPVVMTTHTGMAEYYNPRYFYGVSSPTTSAAPLGGEWFEPSIDDAADHLRAVYEDYGAAEEKARLAAAYVRTNFSLYIFSARIAALLRDFL